MTKLGVAYSWPVGACCAGVVHFVDVASDWRGGVVAESRKPTTTAWGAQKNAADPTMGALQCSQQIAAAKTFLRCRSAVAVAVEGEKNYYFAAVEKFAEGASFHAFAAAAQRSYRY